MTEGTQRRLAAIVSADVVGYSRLVGTDETGTLVTLRAHRAELIDPLIAKHGGRIVKTMGDGLLLEFPSVVNAVDCAIAVQRGMGERNADVDEDERITFRVGINLGDIIIDGEDIYGDGVNVAARLQEVADPGGVCLSRRVHEEVQDRLDVTFLDGGEQSLKNIARPVEVWRWTPETVQAPVRATDDAPLPQPDKPSICVVPFRNLVGNVNDDYLADGVTENIIVSLTRFSELFVVAHRSAVSGAAQFSDPAELADRLGVRYLLVGGVARIGERIRVTVNLTEAQSGEALWAERYDRELGDIFNLQEEISDTIVAKLFVRVLDADRRRTEWARTEDLDAYELVLRGRHLLKSPKKEMRESAKACFERAIELYPNSASAHAWLACYYLMCLFHPHSDDHDHLVEQTLNLANKAVELDSSDYFARIMLANACYLRRDFENAHRHAQFSFDQNPNDYEVLCSKGWIDALCGNTEEGLACSNRAMRFNPLAPDDCLMTIGLAEFNSENYEAALAAFSAMRTFFAWKSAGMAASCARLGKWKDAKEAARMFMDAASDEFEAEGDELRQRLQTYWHGLFIFQDTALGEKFYDSIRQAGIPI